jgi:hypothetical protein
MWSKPVTIPIRIVVLCLLLLPKLRSTETLTVCEALDRLTELNGHEVSVRGVWLISDIGEVLWASPECAQPIVRDGWVWKNTISVVPDDVHRRQRVYEQYDRLPRNREPTEVLASLTGVLRTKEHFKTNRDAGLPYGYTYSVARLTFSAADRLEAHLMDETERRRYEILAQSPWPVRVKRRRH